MVASYDVGKPVRSYVLIPGTGSNKDAKPLCLDLASTSSVAGAVPVPSTIPQTVPVGSLAPNKEMNDTEEKNDDRKEESGSESGNSGGSHNLSSPSVASAMPQQPAVPENVSRGGVKRSLPDETSDEEDKGAVPRETKVMKGEGTATPSPEVVELQKKCMQLEKQNKTLERRLAMFHDLFRSKERIINFVKFLESTS